MGRSAKRNAEMGEEYHSYVLRVRVQPDGQPAPALSIRIEYVNGHRASHFSELAGALDFIRKSVREDVLQSFA